MTARKCYLGDSVYADLVDGQLVLTTENGGESSNTIVLEDETLQSLERYVGFLRDEARAERAKI